MWCSSRIIECILGPSFHLRGGVKLHNRSQIRHNLQRRACDGVEWRAPVPKGKDFTFILQVYGSYSRLHILLITGIDFYWSNECSEEPIIIFDHPPVSLKIKTGPNE